MKKLSLLKSMLLLCALVAGSGSAWAADGDKISITNWYSFLGVTASAGSLTGDNNKDYSGTIDGITVTYKKASYQYVKADDLRIYSGSEIIFTAPTGYLITEIDFGGTSSEEKAPTADTGTFNYSTKKWTGSANSITLSRSSGSGYTKFNHATFTLTAAVNISAVGWNTFSSPAGLNFTSVTTAKAYMVTGASGSTLTLTQATGTVPANTGLLISGTESAKIDIPVIGTSTTDVSANKLKAGTGASVNAEDKYVMVARGGKAVFAPTNENAATVPVGKAYLDLEGVSLAPGFVIDDSEATGILSLESQKSLSDGNFYDLQGRKVTQPTKGLYIVNGKKVVIK